MGSRAADVRGAPLTMRGGVGVGVGVGVSAVGARAVGSLAPWHATSACTTRMPAHFLRGWRSRERAHTASFTRSACAIDATEARGGV